MNHGWVLFASLGLTTAILPMMAQPHKQEAGKPVIAASSTPKPASPTSGELLFQQNCARCHDAPQSFPPRISGTIVRHMRVRALLSERDEKELLKFLNP